MPYIYDPGQAPNRRVEMPKTAPVPSLSAHSAEVKAQREADEVKWQKTLSDFEAAKQKAEVEGKEPPKTPSRTAPKVEYDMQWPAPKRSDDPDLRRLGEQLGWAVEEAFEQAGEMVCQVKKETILNALTCCRQDPALCYEMLSDMTATHYPAGLGFNFSVAYHLTSVGRRKRLRLRILIPEGFQPESATKVYPGANWLEREIFDMLGIAFKDHPDMTRILCPDDWEGHPLRKEYPVVGLGQREIDYREDRSGALARRALEAAGHREINQKPIKAL
jgi:NADH-quinone oxidoreductase subunit C